MVSQAFVRWQIDNYYLYQRGAGKSTPHACLEQNTTWDLVDDIEKLREHLEIPEWQVILHHRLCTVYILLFKILM